MAYYEVMMAFFGELMEQDEVKVKNNLRGQYIKRTSRLNQTHVWNSEKKKKNECVYNMKSL